MNFFARGTFGCRDNFELYAEFGYSKKKNTFDNTPSGVSGAWGYPGGPVNARQRRRRGSCWAPTIRTIPWASTRACATRAFDVGPRVIRQRQRDSARFLVGAQGQLGALGLSTPPTCIRQPSLTNERTGFLRYSAVRTALTDPQQPRRLLAHRRRRRSQHAGAVRLHLARPSSANATTSLDMIDFKASRALMDLAGGPLGLALGAE